MSQLNDVDSRVRRFFSVKRKQLLAMRDLPVCEHASLIGGHREELQRVYLSEILPERFRIGRGMVYGPFHRSREADIVVWDAYNYPQLPMLDHAFFFAESVRVVLESKSTWSSDELADVLAKTKAVRDIAVLSRPNLENAIQMLQLDVAGIKSGKSHDGLVITRPHIGTAAIFLSGGQTLLSNFREAVNVDGIDDNWPDAFILLEPGHVILKRYEPIEDQFTAGRSWLDLYEAGDDSLLMFTSGLLSLVTERIVQVEDPLNLWQYAHKLASLEPVDRIEFSLSRPVPQVAPLWSHESDVPNEEGTEQTRGRVPQ